MPFLLNGQKKKEKDGHCSWCFNECTHFLIEGGKVASRSVYRCGGCQRSTLTCLTKGCQAFTRDVPGFAEKRCYVHRKIIQSWDDKNAIKMLNRKGYCSCCFEETEHKVVVINVTKTKYTYECMGCHEATKKCKLDCGAFAPIGRDRCSKCRDDIQDWSNVQENKKYLCVTMLCTWCLNETEHIIRNHQKNTFQCLSCYCPTAPCSKADCNTMKAKSSCIKCIKKDSLPEMLAKKKAHDKIYKTIPSLKQELKRSSNYRDRALREGLIRPFLSLVSMHPNSRAQVGWSLGILLSTKDKVALDAHAEAHILIFDANRGIQSRAMGATETISGVLTKKHVDWYGILHRVMRNQVPQEKWVELPPSTLESSITPGDEDMIRLESLLVNFYLDQNISNASDIAKQNFEMLMQGPEFKHFSNKMKKSAYYRPEMVVYTKLSLAQAFHQAGLHNRDTLLSRKKVANSTILQTYSGLQSETKTEAVQTNFISTEVAAANAIGTIGTNVATTQIVSAFFPILGMAVLAGNVGHALCGETLQVALLPVRAVMLQKALLLARGMIVDEVIKEDESESDNVLVQFFENTLNYFTNLCNCI